MLKTNATLINENGAVIIFTQLFPCRHFMEKLPSVPNPFPWPRLRFSNSVTHDIMCLFPDQIDIVALKHHKLRPL